MAARMRPSSLTRLRQFRVARVAISAKVVADMLTAVGVDRVLTMDLHADQIQGFFNIPVDNIYATPILLADIWKQKYDNLLVVSPDVGGVVRARSLAGKLGADLAIVDKRREREERDDADRRATTGPRSGVEGWTGGRSGVLEREAARQRGSDGRPVHG